MIKLRNSLVFVAAMGLAVVAFGEEKVTAAPAATEIAAAVVATTPAPVAKVVKAKKVAHHKMKKMAMTKLNLDALNAATVTDLEKAVTPKVAQQIIDTRTKLGGKFENEKQLCKEAKLHKAQIKKLAKVFAVSATPVAAPVAAAPAEQTPAPTVNQ